MLNNQQGFDIRCVVVGNPNQSKYDELRAADGLRLISSTEYDEENGQPIAGDSETDIVVEVIGGSDGSDGDPFEKTRERLLQVIRAGKHVVTANKTVLSSWGTEVFAAADDAGVNVGFEASVAGSIPIIRLLREHWRGQPIRKIAGIMNGTCNYILSEMPGFSQSGSPSPDSEESNPAMQWALEKAQAAGLAEADPSFDVDGHDAAQKLSILASIVFDTAVEPTEENIPRSSILPISLEDLELVEKLGFVIKPLAVAEKKGDDIELRVHPCLVKQDHPLANVSGAYNAIYVESEPIEDVTEGFVSQLYYGQGAGGEATATALFSDVMDIQQRIRNGVVDNPSYYCSDKQFNLVSCDDQVSSGYLKSISKDEPGIFMRKTVILYGESEIDRINIQQIYNLHELRNGELVPDVITIGPTPFGTVRRALARFKDEGVSVEEPLFLRIEN
jgi:homoserine dehydrogenase